MTHEHEKLVEALREPLSKIDDKYLMVSAADAITDLSAENVRLVKQASACEKEVKAVYKEFSRVVGIAESNDMSICEEMIVALAGLDDVQKHAEIGKLAIKAVTAGIEFESSKDAHAQLVAYKTQKHAYAELCDAIAALQPSTP